MASGCESWSFSSHIVTLRGARLRLGLTYQQRQSRGKERAELPDDFTGPLIPMPGGTPPLDLLQCEIRKGLIHSKLDWLPAVKSIPTKGKQSWGHLSCQGRRCWLLELPVFSTGESSICKPASLLSLPRSRPWPVYAIPPFFYQAGGDL